MSEFVGTKKFRVDGRDEYSVDFYRDGRKYEMYCTAHPQNGFSAEPQKTHLYDSGKICVIAGKEPDSMDRAKAIAMTWADGYSKYIRTGVFPNGARRVNV